jgi:mRNA-degrading endonuclease toxin of MazEF toxin-antitoxin module
VANVSQVTSLDRSLLAEPAGTLSRSKLQVLLAGIDVVLGR